MNVFEIILAIVVGLCAVMFFFFVIIPLTMLGSVKLFVWIATKIDERKDKKRR